MTLTRMDSRRVAPGRAACTALMVVRNEALRLPHVLAHHRALGVDRFLVVDNASADGSLDYLLAQPDCHVFRTADSFREASFGMDWINWLAGLCAPGSWCLFVDADELLTYPHAESLTLPQLCAFLDRTGSEGVPAMMLDMYNPGPIRAAHYRAGTPFLDTCPHFDTDYRVQPALRTGRQPEIVGGPRLRLFYPELHGVGRLGIAARRALRALRLHPVGAALGLSHLRWGAGLPPELRKVPLLKVRPGLRWIGNHAATPFVPAPLTAALLHFKFFSDFHARAVQEAARGQHWDGSAEYARYAAIIEARPDATFFHAGSETFRSSAQLVALGLMRDDTASVRDGAVQTDGPLASLSGKAG
ncbi:glycosyltransferase family 2 protein [Methylobacterium oryzihabitans]|uniref:Glycosyltransferase family 2 protein n=1 Tax=Methylobacterium oryzihabitans TaxID=2499852 RepID=A0A437P1E5_9HYPH|nr:glycosyltransferase family 2 protein [Methylobacterium oryzihabitans]RVU15948.1 glycosyltransferase family 2 protein [Methylobacterium oryzihabitans]